MKDVCFYVYRVGEKRLFGNSHYIYRRNSDLVTKVAEKRFSLNDLAKEIANWSIKSHRTDIEETNKGTESSSRKHLLQHTKLETKHYKFNICYDGPETTIIKKRLPPQTSSITQYQGKKIDIHNLEKKERKELEELVVEIINTPIKDECDYDY